MRIEGWHVDGFGILHEFDQGGLGPGVTVLLGENEAGKSTLLAFLRAVLFGSADGGAKDWAYEPLRGGRHGGRLLLRDEVGGLWTVERYADVKKKPAVVTRPGGSAGEEVQLAALLGDATPGTFRSVFAFGLDDLQRFESLTGKDVGERIFDSGVTGAGTSAREVRRRLGSRQDALLKLRGSARINDVAAQLDEVGAAVRDAQRVAAQYQQLKAAQEEADDRAESLRRQSDDLQREKTEIEALIQLRPQWEAVETHRQELAGLPEPEDPQLPDKVAGLVVELEGQRAREERLPRLETQRSTEAAAVAAALARLGGAWSIARVTEFDTSVAIEDEVRSWATGLNDAGRLLREARQKQAAADAEVTRLDAQCAGLRAAIPVAEPLSLEEIDRRETLVRALRDDLGRCERLRLEAERDVPPPTGARAWTVFVLAALAALAAVGAWLTGSAQLGIGLVIAAVLLAVAGVLTRATGAGRASAAAGAPGVIDGLVASMAEMAGSLGLPTEPSSGDLAACEADLRTARSRRAEWDAVCDRVHDAEKEAAEAGRLAGEAAEAEDRAQQILDETAAEWSAWLARRDLDGLTPEGLQDVLTLVNDARTADGRRAAADSDMAAIAQKAAAWDASARRCLVAAQRPDSGLSDEALRTALIALDGALDRRQDLLREVMALERTINVGLASCRDLERAKEDLASGDVGVWQDELQTASTKLNALREERDAAIKDATEAQGEWQSIEKSADLARLQGERESLSAELAELVHEYRVVSAATALIAETLKTFVRERQPAVLASGSAAFATVTGGSYTAVQLDAEAELQSVVVIDDKGRLKKPGALSTGTQQQLYLAIRLALADEFGRSNVPLPLIMDDCLVNFDPKRAAAVAGLLAERSADGQCLLFTCHPETAALMEAQKSADRPVRVIEMPGS